MLVHQLHKSRPDLPCALKALIPMAEMSSSLSRHQFIIKSDPSNTSG